MTRLPQSGERERLRRMKDLLDGWDAKEARKPQKRSLTIAGHRTSISLEGPFWDGLRAIAAQKDASVAALVTAVDSVRGEVSLSSAIRLFVYDRVGAQAAVAAEPEKPKAAAPKKPRGGRKKTAAKSSA